MKCFFNNILGDKVRNILVASLVLLLSACASGARTGSMVVPFSPEKNIEEGHPVREAVQVGGVDGGKETNALWTSQISNESFKDALEQTLALHTMLAENDARYRLDVELVELNQPFIGLNMTVKADVKYRLTDTTDGSVLFDEVFHSEYTAAFGDSLLGSKRLQLANEGAVRNNIQLILEKLIGLGNAIDQTASVQIVLGH